jgi:hypothetical protein
MEPEYIIACLHTKTPKGHFAASLFCLIVILISCIRPLLYFAPWTSPGVTRPFGCWPQHVTHGTRYQHIWPLCQKHVTRLFNYPTTLCILNHFCCNTSRCNFCRWSSGHETAPQCENKATQYPTALDVWPQSYPTTPIHRLARAQDTTT